MKFLFPIASAALLAATATAKSSYHQASSQIAPLDDLEVPGANPLKHCKDPADDILTLKSVDLDPNPPKAGTTLTVKASGELSEDIEEGAQVKLQVKYGVITLIRQTADLCDTASNVDLECPLKKGELNLTKDVDLPKEIPPGRYTVVADVTTKDGDPITCLTATVEFKRGGAAFWQQVM